MEEFQKLGVFLNAEPGDEEALDFTAIFARIAQATSVLCIHVGGLEDEFAPPAPTPEQVRHAVLTRFPPALADRTAVEVSRETGVAEMLRKARDHSLDLVVVGRRLPHDQRASAMSFIRLARKAPCSVLVVPDRSRPQVGRILVPSDASEHSKLAVENAVAIARASGKPEPQVVVQSVYSVGYGYRYSGLTFHEAVRRLEEQTMKRLTAFLADVDTADVQLDIVCTCSEYPAAAVYDLAASRNIGLVLVGSRGRSASTAILLGSFAERLLGNAPLPVMVIRRKGETLGLLEALLYA